MQVSGDSPAIPSAGAQRYPPPMDNKKQMVINAIAQQAIHPAEEAESSLVGRVTPSTRTFPETKLAANLNDFLKLVGESKRKEYSQNYKQYFPDTCKQSVEDASSSPFSWLRNKLETTCVSTINLNCFETALAEGRKLTKGQVLDQGLANEVVCRESEVLLNTAKRKGDDAHQPFWTQLLIVPNSNANQATI